MSVFFRRNWNSRTTLEYFVHAVPETTVETTRPPDRPPPRPTDRVTNRPTDRPTARARTGAWPKAPDLAMAWRSRSSGRCRGPGWQEMPTGPAAAKWCAISLEVRAALPGTPRAPGADAGTDAASGAVAVRDCTSKSGWTPGRPQICDCGGGEARDCGKEDESAEESARRACPRSGELRGPPEGAQELAQSRGTILPATHYWPPYSAVCNWPPTRRRPLLPTGRLLLGACYWAPTTGNLLLGGRAGAIGAQDEPSADDRTARTAGGAQRHRPRFCDHGTGRWAQVSCTQATRACAPNGRALPPSARTRAPPGNEARAREHRKPGCGRSGCGGGVPVRARARLAEESACARLARWRPATS